MACLMQDSDHGLDDSRMSGCSCSWIGSMNEVWFHQNARRRRCQGRRKPCAVKSRANLLVKLTAVRTAARYTHRKKVWRFYYWHLAT
jgi:hypothetical protein